MTKAKFLFPTLLLVTALSACNFPTGPHFDLDYEVIPNTFSYKDYANNSYYKMDYCPTIGKPKILVIPVWFTNSSKYIKSYNKDGVRDDIRKAYIGSVEETGWHSVSSYYYAESYQKCDIQATVSEWYECGYESTYFYDEYAGLNRGIDLVKKATEWYFENNPEDNRKDYDTDHNGQLDGVLLIYGSPDYSNLPAAVKSTATNMWAYCNWISEYKNIDVEKPIPNVYFWASYDFMYSSGNDALARAGTKYGSGDTSHCIIDTHTFIHEMGHVFGLEDYYDYSVSGCCPAGGFSMQDYNVGGHDPYSLLAFNWVDPIVIHNGCTIDIGTFQDTHDLVLLSSSRTYSGSPFDEYMLVELYSPTGLNQLDSTYQYAGGYPKGSANLGIRVWHVDARLAYFANDRVVINEVYNDPTAENFQVNHAFSNTYEDKDYGSVLGKYDNVYYYYNILQLIRKDTSANYRNKKLFKESEMFFEGDVYRQFDYSSQFVNGTRLNNMDTLNWSFRINSIDDSKANITFTLLGK